MPMSATGDRRLPREAGVSLVEMMVVLFIAGLVAGAALLVMPGPDRTLHETASRLAARMAAASDESVMLNRRIALVVSAEGYRFERLEENGWIRVGDRAGLAPTAWPRGVAPNLPRPGADGPPGGRVATFDPVGGATPVRIALSDGGGRAGWAVEIDGSGAVHVDRID